MSIARLVQLEPDPETQGALYQTVVSGAGGGAMGGVYGAVGSAFSKDLTTNSAQSLSRTMANVGKHAGLFGAGFAIYGGTRATVKNARGRLDVWAPVTAGALSGAFMGSFAHGNLRATIAMSTVFAVVATIAEMGQDKNYLFDFSGLPDQKL